jgi:GNAT superfamily N-acetyltransferase
VGFGRVLSDGAYQAALYDVVVLPAWQGRGIGRAILEHLLQKVRDCNAILYANPGKEGFYGRLGFRRLTTGMGRFLRPGRMEEKGMIEPDKP